MTTIATEKTSTQKYPLKLENWGDDSYFVVSRGHHDLAAFKQKVNEEYDHFGNFFESAYHSYLKATPSSEGTVYSHVGPDTRGAFPATCAQEGWSTQFGDNTWDRQVFKNGDIVVPLHDEYGSNPPVETCYGNALKGEAFLAVSNVEGRPRKFNRITEQYRLANAKERAVGHRI